MLLDFLVLVSPLLHHSWSSKRELPTICYNSGKIVNHRKHLMVVDLSISHLDDVPALSCTTRLTNVKKAGYVAYAVSKHLRLLVRALYLSASARAS